MSLLKHSDSRRGTEERGTAELLFFGKAYLDLPLQISVKFHQQFPKVPHRKQYAIQFKGRYLKNYKSLRYTSLPKHIPFIQFITDVLWTISKILRYDIEDKKTYLIKFKGCYSSAITKISYQLTPLSTHIYNLTTFHVRKTTTTTLKNKIK